MALPRALKNRFACLAILATLLFLLVAWTAPAFAASDAVPAPQTPIEIKGKASAADLYQRNISPVIVLTEYQKRWIQDQSRFKIGKMTRQGGKSFGTSLEAVFDCYEHKTKWVFLSAGERQSKELMATAAMHARAIGLAIEEVEGTFKDENSKSEYKQLEIIFPNGSRIIGLPANPSTARGHSAHILLDEFAFHKDSRAIWRALFPTVTRGYKIRIISTPQGKKNKFYELWTAQTLQSWDGKNYEYKGERGGWSKHNVTIIDAVAMGLILFDDEGNPCEPEDLRLAFNDDEAWAQEYLVEFIDEATAWLTYDLIESCEDGQLNAMPLWAEQLVMAAVEHHEQYKALEVPPAFDSSDILAPLNVCGDLYAGFDVARRRDLSIIWLDEEIAGTAWARAVIELRKAPFGVQRLVFFSLLKLPNLRRACVDETGMGMDIAEKGVELFGSTVEPVTFTGKSKEALANGIRKGFEDRTERIPVDTTIRQSLHSIKKTTTTTGAFRYDADRDDTTGHADHFWAKALAKQARSTVGPAAAASPSEPDKTNFHAERRPGLMNRMGGMFRRSRA